MMSTSDRPDVAGDRHLLAELGALREPAPTSLRDAVFDGWVSSASVLGQVWVAATRRGVSFVRPVSALSEAEFRESYRRRFGRPLRPAESPPDGLDAALTGAAGAAPRLDLLDLSDFGRDVLAATRTIPVGETRPYGWVAAEVGRPGAVRAAGSVLARNPVPLLVPCHRVVRGDGTTGRYLFGEDTKRDLIERERAAFRT